MPKPKPKIADIPDEKLRDGQRNLWRWLDENFGRLSEPEFVDEFEKKQKVYDAVVRELTRRGVKTMDTCPVCQQDVVDLEHHLRFANDAEHSKFLESQEARSDAEPEPVDNSKEQLTLV